MAVPALLLWLALIAVGGVLLAGRFIGIAIAGPPQASFATPQALAAAAVVALACLLAALITRRLAPAATVPVTCVVGGSILLLAAVTTGGTVSALVAVAILALSWLAGDAVLTRLPASNANAAIRVPLASALGLGLLGLLLLLLATVGRLDAVTVAAGAVVIAATVLAVDHERLRLTLRRARAWRPRPPSWFETIVVGSAVGLVTYAMLADFVPEILADATRTHLPIAREIWQTGSAPYFPQLFTSREPIQAHLLYAVAWGFGGVAAVKLLHALVGLLTIVGVAGISWLVAGRAAAVISAALVATTPIVLWQLGHAFQDLFPVLFTVAALLCLLLWQRDGARRWLVGAGALAGFGFATKPTMIAVIVALAAAIALVGRGPWRWRERVSDVALFGIGTLVALPWIVRTYSITGTALQGHTYLIDSLMRQFQETGAPSDALPAGSVSSQAPHATLLSWLADLLLSPWNLVFHAETFSDASFDVAPIGIALLMLLPLALLAPRTRAIALLGVAMVVSYVAWWFSPHHVVRHLMPTLAIAAALAGSGVASVLTAAGDDSPARRSLRVGAKLGLIVGLMLAYVVFVPAERTRLAVDVLAGRETADEYIQREVHLAPLLAEASALLPPDTLVGYTGTAGPGYYTEARLAYLRFPELEELGSRPGEIRESLEQRGMRYFIWDRAVTPAVYWDAPLLSTEFLYRHTRILAGESGGYLFELLPDGTLAWGAERPRIVADDPGLGTVGEESSPWRTVGNVTAREGVVWLTPNSALAQRVEVDGGQAYVLNVTARCDGDESRAYLALRWFDSAGKELGVAREPVVLGKAPSAQFLWRRAPATATMAMAELSMPAKGTCQFDRVSLHELS